MAIAALGLMRSGSSSGTNGPSLDCPRPNRSSHAHRTASRAPSIASTASRSAPGLSSSTGTSSPVGPASLAPGSEAGDGEGSEYGDGEGDPRFIARVSQLPLVSGGLEWYERSKASSRVVKVRFSRGVLLRGGMGELTTRLRMMQYGAGLVESSLSAVSRPLANNLQLGQLDDFACRQLDRLGGGGGVLADAREAAARRAYDEEERGREEELEERGRQGVRDPSATAEVGVRTESQNQQAVAVASRSRWQTVLVEAGGLGAAVSEESLKSLRYCLQWLLVRRLLPYAASCSLLFLQYATAHLDHQITVLRDFILSLRRHPTSDARSDALVTASASAHLVQIKHDVVETIRKVVEVVSKYAGVALPEQAKRYVRQSILGLPVKWASAIEGGRDGRGASVGTTSSASTPTAERMEEPSRYGDGPREQDEGRDGGEGGEGAGNPALRPTEDAAERVLTFAVESLDMLRSVTSIFGDSVEKAEACVSLPSFLARSTS